MSAGAPYHHDKEPGHTREAPRVSFHVRHSRRNAIVETLMQCTQIVLYRIRPDALDDFHAIKEQLITEAHTLPGLLSSVTLASPQDPTRFVDQMQWESPEAAQAAMPLFEALPTTPRFMALMQGPPEVAEAFVYATGDALDRATA